MLQTLGTIIRREKNVEDKSSSSLRVIRSKGGHLLSTY